MRSSATRSNRVRRKAFFKDSTMMWLLLVLAFIILIGGGVARILLDRWNMLPEFIESGMNPVVLMGLSYYCLAFSKRYEARIGRDSAAAHVLAEDPRPPVVYLRSFKADDDEGQPRWLQLETQEEKLNSFFSKIGPFVGLGKPDEDFPTLGATRMYVDNDWEKTITALMSHARLVVLRAGDTDSLIWEVKYATQ